jgi:RecG-like helicase
MVTRCHHGYSRWVLSVVVVLLSMISVVRSYRSYLRPLSTTRRVAATSASGKSRPRSVVKTLKASASPINGNGVDFMMKAVTELHGVGNVLEERLKKMDLLTVRDVLLNVPYKITDNSQLQVVSQCQENEKVVVELTVQATRTDAHPRPCRVICSAADGSEVDISYFLGPKVSYIWFPMLKTTFRQGNVVVVGGRLTKYQNKYSIVNPEFVVKANDAEKVSKYLVPTPIYSLTSGLTAAKYRSVIDSAVELFQQNSGHVADWQCPLNREKLKWPSLSDEVVQLHRPKSAKDARATSAVRERLAFDELVALELNNLMKLRRQADKHRAATADLAPPNFVVTPVEKTLIELQKVLPFQLTSCQREAIDAVSRNLASDKRMVRFVQGDVGSGKTGTYKYSVYKIIDCYTLVVFFASGCLVCNCTSDCSRSTSDSPCPDGSTGPAAFLYDSEVPHRDYDT